MSRVAIIGAAETALGKRPEVSRLGLHAEAARLALADAGLRMREVDGIFSSVADPNELSEYFGIVPRWLDGTNVGGCSTIIQLRHAAAAIAAGYCSVALIVHGESGRSWVDMERAGTAGSPVGQFEAPYGAAGAATLFALPVLRHFHEFGTTKWQMAHVPAATREWALLNPKAMMHKAGPITPEDVLASRVVCWPFNLLDCCLVADGGGAIVVVGPDRARDAPKRPVWAIGTGEGAAHRQVAMMRDFCTSDAAVRSSRAAFAEAGVTAQDFRHAMLYDAFSFTPMLALEDLGFCGRGESGAFVAQRHGEAYHTGPGGKLAMNTNGGGLSHVHTGRYGIFALIEAVAQLRGEAGARQVADLDLSLVHGPGRHFAAAGTVVLTNR